MTQQGRTKTKIKLVDTNVILRYLIEDGGEKAEQAKKLMKRVETGEEFIEISALVTAEIIWTLEKVYKIPRADVVARLLDMFMLTGVKSKEKRVITRALNVYGTMNVDFTDCYLVFLSKESDVPVYSFDRKDFTRLAKKFDFQWETP